MKFEVELDDRILANAIAKTVNSIFGETWQTTPAMQAIHEQCSRAIETLDVSAMIAKILPEMVRERVDASLRRRVAAEVKRQIILLDVK